MSFDLEKTIAGWKQPYLHDDAFTPEDVEELENSLRDRVDDLIQKGLPAREAFARAAAHIGSLETTGNEYKKVYWGKARREGRLKDALGVKMAMFSNYLNVARRSLVKQKGYAAINIIGLTVGLASFILIGLYVQFELSFDRFHENADRIYRIEEENPNGFYLGNNQFAVTPSPLSGVLMQEFPDVEFAVQIDDARSLISSGDKHFYENGLFATEHFFAVFDFHLLQGDPQTALSSPNAIILTESLAAKYFGEKEAIGKILAITHLDQQSSERQELIITGVMQDVPAASHFHFDYVVPFMSSPLLARNMEDWGTSTSYTFVLLGSETALPRFTGMLAEAYSRYNADAAQNGAGIAPTSVYYPTPLTDIHLHSQANFQLGIQSDIRYIYLLSGLAVLILLIACINYINLTTARSSTRTMEAGVRKVMGARRRPVDRTVRKRGRRAVVHCPGRGVNPCRAYHACLQRACKSRHPLVLSGARFSGWFSCFRRVASRPIRRKRSVIHAVEKPSSANDERTASTNYTKIQSARYACGDSIRNRDSPGIKCLRHPEAASLYPECQTGRRPRSNTFDRYQRPVATGSV